MKTLIEKTSYLVMLFSTMVLSIFPRNIAILLGKQLGISLYLLGIRKNVARKNIEIAFKNNCYLKREKILFNCYIHFGIVLIDFLRQQLINKSNRNKYFTFHRKDKEILFNENGGCIMSAHLGNWELVLPAMGLNGIKMDTVIKEQRNKSANKYYIKMRTFENINLIWKKGALRELYDSILNNKYIGLASDQNAGGKGIRINFFDKSSSFPKGAGLFYNRISCKIFVVLCILGSDYKYHVYLEEISTNKENKSEDEIVMDITKKYVKIITKKIKQFPEQYFWFHKKWDKEIYN